MKQISTLLIGIGGTGCAVVRELKKKLYTEWRVRGGSELYPEVYVFEATYGGEKVQSRVATLSIDSNSGDLEGEGEKDSKWRVFGQTLRLKDREKVLIDPVGVSRVLMNLERHPHIAPWIRGDVEFVDDITRGVTGPVGCNQIRRMGRLALANARNVEKALDAINERLGKLSKDGTVGAEVHVACTLACGTGSGAVVDLVAQLQRVLRGHPGSQVIIHGFATARDVGSVNTGNFYANQYAALEELNAFRVAAYKPWDIKQSATSTAQRLRVPKLIRNGQAGSNESAGSGTDIDDTYKSLALLTNLGAAGHDLSIAEQVETAAEFIYQLSVGQMGDMPVDIRKSITSEDRSQYPTDVNGGDRATNLISYGVQKIAIPEREIREKLSYVFARQFVLKSLFQNWDNGYRATEKAFAQDFFVAHRRPIWQMTREHLMLDLAEDATGAPEHERYMTEWNEQVNLFAKHVKEQLGDARMTEWLTELDQRVNRYSAESFRRIGLENYFVVRKEAQEIASRARRLREALERDLIDGFERLDREYPVHHFPAAVKFLSSQIDLDRRQFGEDQEKAAAEVRNILGQKAAMEQKYARGGMFAGKVRRETYPKYIEALVHLHYWSTMDRAAGYALLLCTDLIDQLAVLHDEIETFVTRFKEISTWAKTKADHLIPLPETTSDAASPATADKSGSGKSAETKVGSKKDQGTVYLVNHRRINDEITERFERSAPIQDRQSRRAIDVLSTLRGDEKAFSAYNKRMLTSASKEPTGPLVEKLRSTSEESAIEAHKKLLQEDKNFQGIFGLNIVGKLYSDYGGVVEGPMESWLRDTMGKAMPLIQFAQNEEEMDVGKPVMRRCIFLPECHGVPAEFMHHLRDKFESITGGVSMITNYVHPVAEDRNPSEIVILSIAFFFSARMTSTVHSLREKYLQRLSHEDPREVRRAAFEIYTETHVPKLPTLLKPDRIEAINDARPSLLLACTLGLVHLPDDNKRDPMVLIGVREPSSGMIQNAIPSGMKFDPEIQQAARRLSEAAGQEIPPEYVCLVRKFDSEMSERACRPVLELVDSTLAASPHSIADLGALLDKARGSIFLACGKNQSDPLLRKFETAVADAKNFAERVMLAAQ